MTLLTFWVSILKIVVLSIIIKFGYQRKVSELRGKPLKDSVTDFFDKVTFIKDSKSFNSTVSSKFQKPTVKGE